MSPRAYAAAAAVLSADGRYRYRLTRAWAGGAGRVAFVGLNPSTADASRDDPTARRMVGFARSWGFARLDVVNVCALRARDPAALREASHPDGPENTAWVARVAARAGLVVAAWGSAGGWPGLAARIAALLPLLPPQVHVLGLTRAGHPRHPLYVRADTAPRAWSPTAPASAAIHGGPS